MTFCQIKPIEQQEIPSVQTSRRMLERTLKSTGNHIGALLNEYGFVFAKGKKALREAVARYLAPESEVLNPAVKAVLTILWDQYRAGSHFYKELL